MPPSQLEKAQRFQALHQGPATFFMPNPYDAGSAKLLTTLGFPALATSSGATANGLGRRDGRVTRAEALAHAQAIVAATDLPVSADLEKCFADTLDGVAETIRMAADVGLAGCSIEDATGNPARPLFSLDEAAERVAAAVGAARALPFPFTLTARTENYLNGQTDLADTIRRLQAFEQAGADVLFAPGLPDLDAVRAVVAAVKKPVSFVASMPGKAFSVAELTAAGVRRISTGAALYRAAFGGLLAAAREIQSAGTFNYLDQATPTPEINKLMGNA